MKVLVITPEYPPSIEGGIGTFAHELSLQLAKRGIEIAVATRRRNINGNVEESSVKTYGLFSPTIPPKDTWFYSTNLSKIGHIVKQVNPDIIHDAGLATGFLPWLSRKWNVVTTIHGSPKISEIRTAMGSFEDHLRDILFGTTHSLPTRFLTALAKPDIKAYVYVSKFCLSDTIGRLKDHDLQKSHLHKSRVIYNGVNVEKLREIKERTDREDRQEPLAMTFMGRLMEYKGIRCLLRAFNKAAEEIVDAKLHIIGNGPLYREAKSFIHRKGLTEKVTVHGALPRIDALNVLAKSALLVHPSFYESFGMVIAEAYALGKPVIAHKAGYADEMVEETKAGLTVDVTDPNEFANAMVNLLTDTSLRKKLSAKAETAAREVFNIEATAEKYEYLFREVSN